MHRQQLGHEQHIATIRAQHHAALEAQHAQHGEALQRAQHGQHDASAAHQEVCSIIKLGACVLSMMNNKYKTGVLFIIHTYIW